MKKKIFFLLNSFKNNRIVDREMEKSPHRKGPQAAKVPPTEGVKRDRGDEDEEEKKVVDVQTVELGGVKVNKALFKQ